MHIESEREFINGQGGQILCGNLIPIHIHDNLLCIPPVPNGTNANTKAPHVPSMHRSRLEVQVTSSDHLPKPEIRHLFTNMRASGISCI